jgi:dihydrofolate synthase/folylpolyglutamate synthase
MDHDDPLRFLSPPPPPPGGERTRAGFLEALRRLNEPQRRFAAIHVTGTNGKGSTIAFLDAILRAAGWRTGAYFSPYVFDLRERWCLDGAPVSAAALEAAVAAVRPTVETVEADGFGAITEFERKTLVAFWLFAHASLAIALVEVGIGGRTDATNVIPAPRIAIVTNIGLDHAASLGGTRESIAAHKAGIVKPGTQALITAEPEGAPQRILRAAAAVADVPVVLADDLHLPDGAVLGLLGPHQRLNAATAVAAARALLPEIDDTALRCGLASATLPGRFEVHEGTRGRTLVLDVAHNDDGARTLAAALDAVFPGRPATLVLGVKRTHDPAVFFDALGARIDAVVATAPPFAPLPAETLAAVARGRGHPVRVVEPAAAAIERAWEDAPDDHLVVVTGSFYTVGETPKRFWEL